MSAFTDNGTFNIWSMAALPRLLREKGITPERGYIVIKNPRATDEEIDAEEASGATLLLGAKIGSFWRRRDGNKVELIGFYPEIDFESPYQLSLGGSHSNWNHQSGKWDRRRPATDFAEDIVAPWKD